MSFKGGNNNKRGGYRGKFKRDQGAQNSNSYKGRIKFEKPEYRHQDQLTEEEVGITEYISKLDGYPAVIKARFSDFQVNEIGLDGNIAKLTSTTIPESFESKVSPIEGVEETPFDKLPQSTWEALKNLVTHSGEDLDPVELNAENFSKADRKHIHKVVRKYFGQALVASTITEGEKTIMQFRKWGKKDKEQRIEWPPNTPEFVYFVVYKEMMDTMAVCFKIAQMLRIPPTKIAYAGVKDRRAKTSQWFCIKKYNPSSIIQKTKYIRNVTVGNFEFKDKALRIGQLKGNRFRIALRNVLADDELINSSLTHAKEHGFINYYGLQRFGNDKEVPTFQVGIKLLQGEWKEAVNLILKVKAADDPDLPITKAKKMYADTGDAETASKLCDKRHNTLERKLLEGLAKHSATDYVTALENIPRNIRLMYIHAFQSLIWNKMASKRIQDFGFSPVEGDLVFVDKSQEEKELLEEREVDLEKEDSEADGEKEDTETDGEKDDTEADGEKEDTKSETNQADENSPKKESKQEIPAIRPLQAGELDKYTIFDVVLPLPGYDIIYPENLKQFYKEAIEEAGLSLEMPKQRVRTYNLSGTYRKLVQRASDFTWKITYYNDPTENLIRSDLEELKGEEEPNILTEGKYKAVVVDFKLNPSSYATMVLREILKCNTSSSAQANLNNYGEKKIILEDAGEAQSGKGDISIDQVQQGSLLANKEKYEDFKNSLFKGILEENGAETAKKRELDTEAAEGNEPKKIKTDKV